jgi:hypothetical protein
VDEATIANLAGCGDGTVVQLKASKQAEAAVLRLQLPELRPTKTRLATATTARDKALKGVQRPRLDLAVSEEMVIKKQGQDGVALYLAVVQLIAQQAAEVQEVLVAPAPRTPRAVSEQPAATSPAHRAAGFTASLPQELAASLQEWTQRQPSLEVGALHLNEGSEAVEESSDGIDDLLMGVDPYGSVDVVPLSAAESVSGLAAPGVAAAPAPSPQSFQVGQAASAAFLA